MWCWERGREGETAYEAYGNFCSRVLARLWPVVARAIDVALVVEGTCVDRAHQRVVRRGRRRRKGVHMRHRAYFAASCLRGLDRSQLKFDNVFG
jgi:hypothetical protein